MDICGEQAVYAPTNNCGECSGLESRVRELEEQVQTLVSTVGDLTETVGSYSSRIEALENAIGDKADVVITTTDSDGVITEVTVLGTVEEHQAKLYSTTLYADNVLIINEPLSARDANIALHGAVVEEFPPLDEDNPYEFNLVPGDPNALLWWSYAATIEEVIIATEIHPTSLRYWFMLPSCTFIEMSNLYTDNVTDMSYAFTECGIDSLDLSAWDTSSVTTMSHMFSHAAVDTLDISSFDTSNVTIMDFMFNQCTNLTGLNLVNFDTANVTDMYYMFYGCSDLETIYASEDFVTTALEPGGGDNMFNGCESLVGGSGTVYDSGEVGESYARIDAVGTPGYFTAVIE